MADPQQQGELWLVGEIAKLAMRNREADPNVVMATALAWGKPRAYPIRFFRLTTRSATYGFSAPWLVPRRVRARGPASSASIFSDKRGAS